MTKTKNAFKNHTILIGAAALFVALFLFSGCGAKKNVTAKDLVEMAKGAAVAAAATPVLDVILWSHDSGELTSFWIRGNAAEVVVLGVHSGLVIPMEGALWEWRTNEGEDSTLEVSLHDLVSDEKIVVLQVPEIPEGEECQVRDIPVSATPIGTVGPFMFIRVEEVRDVCEGDDEELGEHIFVYNIAQQAEANEIIDEEEEKKIRESDQASTIQDFDDLSFMGIEPRFSIDGNLMVFYIFSISNSTIQSTTTQQKLSREVQLPATEIPLILIPFVVPPPAVRGTVEASPQSEIGGWNLVTGNVTQMDAVRHAFIQEKEQFQPALD
jgi:hypothetical protein